MRVSLPHPMPALSGIFVAVLVLVIEPSVGHAASSAEEVGLEIATEARERQRGYGNFTANLAMILRNKQGQESQRELHLKVIENLMVMAIAQCSCSTVRVTSREPRFSFMPTRRRRTTSGSIFLPSNGSSASVRPNSPAPSWAANSPTRTWGAAEVEKYTHQFLHNELFGERECTVSERVPVNKDSGYSRQLVWLHREDFRIMKVEFYDRRDAHLKTMVMEDYGLYLDRFWRASKVTMTNHLTGKSTVLLWSDYEFGTDLDVGDFTQTALKRAR